MPQVHFGVFQGVTFALQAERSRGKFYAGRLQGYTPLNLGVDEHFALPSNAGFFMEYPM